MTTRGLRASVESFITVFSHTALFENRSNVINWIQTHRITTLTPTDGVSSLVEVITGEHVRGSWWNHPKAQVIYHCYQKLLVNKDILTTKLVAGKVTFVYSDLWPVLLRVVLDDEWRVAAMIDLSSDAKRLLEQVEANGTLSLSNIEQACLGRKTNLKRVRAALEQRGLVISRETHTDSGTHITVLESWRSFKSRTGTPLKAELKCALALDELKAWAHNTRLVIGRIYVLGEGWSRI